MRAFVECSTRNDFVGGIGPDGGIINGIFGGRPRSKILTEASVRLADTAQTKIEKNSLEAAWGEYGGKLLTQSLLAPLAESVETLILPFGFLVSPLAYGKVGPFSTVDNWRRLVARDTVAMSLYNNSSTPEQRAMTERTLREGDSIFSQVVRDSLRSDHGAIGPLEPLDQSEPWLALQRKRQAAALRVERIRRNRDTLKAKLGQRDERIAALRQRESELRRSAADQQEPNDDPATA